MLTQINSLTLFFASKQFWLCNIIGWLAHCFAQSLIDSFSAGAVLANFYNQLPHAILCMLVSLCIHITYLRLRWYNRHPMSLIPVACLISVFFAGVDTLINQFDLLRKLPDICALNHQRAPEYYCGRIINFFTRDLFAMSIWLLFYIIIQAERKTRQKITLKRSDVFKAIIALVALIQVDNILSAVGWASDSSYLFSNSFYLNTVKTFIVVIIFSFYILLLKPGRHFLGSRLLPLVPRLWVMTFCSAVLSIGASAAISNLSYLQTNTDASFLALAPHVILGSVYGYFTSGGQLGGVLQGSFTYILLIELFFIYYRFSDIWQQKITANAFGFNSKKSFIFWSYNLGYWLFFGVLIYASGIMILDDSGKSVPMISTAAFAFFGIFMGAVLRSKTEYYAAKKMAVLSFAIKIFIVSLLTGALLTSAIWLSNYAYIFVVLDGHEIANYTRFVTDHSYVFASILTSCVLCGLWSFICYTVESQQIHRDSTIKQLQLEMNMKEIQLNALAGKIDPHFIFNALNNIRALVDEDSEKARSAIVTLSEILRSPIINTSQNKISIAQEMVLVRNYIALSKIQLEDCLEYVEDVSEDVNAVMIPSMMLQILVENAIKHGISQLPDGGTLSLQIYKAEQQLVCKITNHGQLRLKSTTSGFGVGIKNINERITLLYGDNAQFGLQSVNDCVIAELKLPIEYS